MIEKLKKPIDKIIYESINRYGLAFYLPILFLLLFGFLTDNASSFAIISSALIVFIQMNYNIYESKLKKDEEINIRTMEVLNKSYMNVNNFTKEEQILLIEFRDCEDYDINKLIIEQDITQELREKILTQYNLLEYLSTLINQKLISKEVYIILMHKEIMYWIKRSQLLTFIGGEKPEYFISFCINEKMIDKNYINF